MNKEIKNIQTNEIDLIQLIKLLWYKKWWIMLAIFSCTSIAGIYAFTAKEQWTSKAEILPPKIVDLGDYLSLRKEYSRILGSEFDLAAFSNGLFNRFERLAYSIDEREEFLLNSDLYKSLSEGKDEKSKRNLLNNLARENFSITKPDPKKDPDAIGRKFSFYSEDPKSAQTTLKDFVIHINQSAFYADLKDFILLANEKVADLKFEYSNIKNNLNIYKNVQLDNLNKAYNMAEKAGVKEYSKVLLDDITPEQNFVVTSDAKVSLSDSKLGDHSYLFMLGEKYLKAQIDVIKQNQLIYPPRYYQIEKQLKELSFLLSNTDKVESNTFSYLSSPDYPIMKDKPKKGMILLIGAMIGASLSILTILIFNALKINHRTTLTKDD